MDSKHFTNRKINVIKYVISGKWLKPLFYWGLHFLGEGLNPQLGNNQIVLTILMVFK
jgi:hypothetical protein